jgi:hypothetical protein
MPDFVYNGPGERFYPESRDSYGVRLGTVQPGDVARFDEAPDQWWRPYEAQAAGEADGAEVRSDDAGEAGAAEADAPAPPGDPDATAQPEPPDAPQGF